jgi:hypothetical protein
MKKLLLILFCWVSFCPEAYGLIGDVTDDNIVDVNDFGIFCDYWLQAPVTDPNCDFNEDGQINFIDFTLLAQNWTGNLHQSPQTEPPQAIDANFVGYTFITKEISLTAAAGSRPVTGYKIVSVPNDINVYLQDPASGCGKITVNLLPYTLRNHGSTLWLAADNNENFSFTFKATDGLYDSNIATIDVNVLPNPKDCLSFDEQGWISIPDHDKLDLVPPTDEETIDGRGIGFCFSTRKPFMGILKKHEAGKAGYEVNLVSGKIVVNIYDVNGIVAMIKSNYRHDNGQWTNVVFAYDGTNNKLEMYIGFGAVISDANFYSEFEFFLGDDAVSVPSGSYVNDCNLIIGKSNEGSYKWEIDAIRSYTLNYSESSYIIRHLTCFQSREAAGNTLTNCPVSIVQFKCNYDGTNNTYTQIYDNKSSHLIGTFNDANHVKYIPQNWYWNDINVQRYRLRR